MDQNKIIFVSMPRSGSTYLCRLVRECFAAQDLDFLKINPEISNIEQWLSNRQNIIDEHKDTIDRLNLNVDNINNNFVNRIFLHYTTQPKPLVLKYFPFDSADVSLDEIVALSKKHKIRLFGLYRQNILDTFISKIIVHNIGDSEVRNSNLMMSVDFKYNPDILEYDIIECYQKYYEIHKKLKELNMFEAVIKYEDLTFDSKKDSVYFYKNMKAPINSRLTEKIVLSDVKHRVLTQLPFLKTDLIHSLKSSGVPVTDDFYFYLDN